MISSKSFCHFSPWSSTRAGSTSLMGASSGFTFTLVGVKSRSSSSRCASGSMKSKNSTAACGCGARRMARRCRGSARCRAAAPAIRSARRHSSTARPCSVNRQRQRDLAGYDRDWRSACAPCAPKGHWCATSSRNSRTAFCSPMRGGERAEPDRIVSLDRELALPLADRADPRRIFGTSRRLDRDWCCSRPR